MATKTISFTLDVGSIDAAIKQVQHARNELVRLMGKLVGTLTAKGVDIAKINIMAYEAVDTTTLYNGMVGIYNESNHVGVIRNDTWYAFYVEYGTGVVGGDNPHPEMDGRWAPPPISYTTASGEERVYTQYDTYGHGLAGWTYEKGEHLYHTIGMPSRPFMYDTFIQLETVAKNAARDLFHTEWR